MYVMVDKKPSTSDEIIKAKLAFISGSMDTFWRLGSAVLLPMIIGGVVDQIKHTDKYVVIGLFVGIILAVMMIIKQALEANKK